MRLVFFGTSSFAVPAVQAVKDDVVLVISQPPKPRGRNRQRIPSPVAVAAEELGLTVSTPLSCKDPAFVQSIRSLNADLLLVAAYGQILPQSLLDSAVRGGINIHASVLPQYRGAAPIQRAILAGETQTGVTLMQMDKGMDTGPIIATTTTRILPDETAGELEARLAQMGANLAVEWLPKIVRGEYKPTPQEERGACLAPKIVRADAELTFQETAETAYRTFRACTPKPGAFVQTRFGELTILACKCHHNGPGGAPGTVLEIGPQQIRAAFAAGSLEFITVRPAGKQPMSAREFANGRRLVIGQSLLEVS